MNTHEAYAGPKDMEAMALQTMTSAKRSLNDLVQLCARAAIGAVFWQSGRTKVDGFELNDTAVYLFAEEYRLPLLDPTLAAGAAALAEHLFPLLLFVGLATRFSALSLLVMTAVIQLFVYPDAWPTHATWAALLGLLLVNGAGRISLDAWLARNR
jgi:putative oxidoreductase